MRDKAGYETAFEQIVLNPAGCGECFGNEAAAQTEAQPVVITGRRGIRPDYRGWFQLSV